MNVRQIVVMSTNDFSTKKKKKTWKVTPDSFTNDRKVCIQLKSYRTYD